jgi:alanine dehydrogenase
MRIQQNLGQRVFASAIDPDLLGKELNQADVAIGALHVGNGRTPMVVSKEMVANMKKGAVIVDVSIDQGGCFETSKVTSHKQPTYLEYDIIHYCVPNIASRTPRTGSHAFSNILLPLLFQSIESNGLDNLLRISTGLQQGIYIYQNYITNKYIADKFGFHYTNISLLLGTNLQ